MVNGSGVVVIGLRLPPGVHGSVVGLLGGGAVGMPFMVHLIERQLVIGASQPAN